MLFNRSTGKPVADILSLDSLIAWLELQPADGTYNYCSASNCLLNQYFTAKGLVGLSVCPGWYYTDRDTGNETSHSLPGGWDAISMGPASERFNDQWTFGKALRRARKLQKESVK